MDLQAMDRCHRIGQTKPVHVYRLATAQSVEVLSWLYWLCSCDTDFYALWFSWRTLDSFLRVVCWKGLSVSWGLNMLSLERGSLRQRGHWITLWRYFNVISYLCLAARNFDKICKELFVLCGRMENSFCYVFVIYNTEWLGLWNMFRFTCQWRGNNSNQML